jgi:long-chain fatty acid transport protein
MRPDLRPALVIAACLAAGQARANPADAFGLGSRSAAMGGAVAADVSDFSAGYYNPAGLARARGLELSVGYFRADHFLAMNGADSAVDPVKGIVGGAVVPGRLFGVPFAIGVALHLPDDRLTRVRALPQGQPRWELYDNRNQRIYFAVNAAVSPWPWLQLGGGVTYMASTTAALDISGHLAALQSQNSWLRHQVDADLKIVTYPQLGARVELSKQAALAVVYRGQFSLALDVDANVHGVVGAGTTDQLTTLALQLQSATIDAFLPQQVVVGASWRPFDALHANFDLTWIDWGAYVPPVSRLTTQLDVPPPRGGWPGGIKPPSAPAPTVVLPIEMHDRVVPHVGAEWRAVARPTWEAFLRAGYEYAKSPIGAQDGSTNYVDRDRHSVSLGAGVRLIAPSAVLPGDVRLDAHAQLSELASATTAKSDPADLVGDYTAGGHIWNVGGTATVGF